MKRILGAAHRVCGCPRPLWIWLHLKLWLITVSLSRFLAPWQAKDPSLDTTKPWNVKLPNGKKIAVFFYNAFLSGEISFNPTATENADRFVQDWLIPTISSPCTVQETRSYWQLQMVNFMAITSHPVKNSSVICWMALLKIKASSENSLLYGCVTIQLKISPRSLKIHPGPAIMALNAGAMCAEMHQQPFGKNRFASF